MGPVMMHPLLKTITQSTSILKTSAVEEVDDEFHKVVGSMEVAIEESVPQWKEIVNVDRVKIKLQEAILYLIRRPNMYRGKATAYSCSALQAMVKPSSSRVLPENLDAACSMSHRVP